MPTAAVGSAVGLSPRVRGNLLPGGENRQKVGSIPACAGEPQVVYSCWAGREVYPRVCGGTASVSPAAVLVGGLSPRVRGNQERLVQADGSIGSIPACAGEPQV